MKPSYAFTQLLAVVCLLIFGMTLVACQKSEHETKAIVRPVKTMVLSKPTHIITRSFPGKVAANQEADLTFQVSGELFQFPVREGMEVKKGQLLARIEPRSFQDRVDEAKARYTFAKAQYERAHELVRKGYLSRSDYDKTRSALDVATANLSTVKTDLGYTYLYAPFAGSIARKYVENFQNVKAKELIVRLQDLKHVDIKVDVPENLMIYVSKANPETKTWVEFPAVPDRKYDTTYKEHAAEADPDTQTYNVTMTMLAPKDINILPGMTATLYAEIPELRGGKMVAAYMLSADAVFSNEKNEKFVWVVNEKNMTIHKQTVTVGVLIGDQIQILSGVKAGERIVIAGVHFLQEGDKVRLLSQDEQGS